jgi:hypothetical protein
MKKIKNFVALGLAGAMFFGSTFTVSAAQATPAAQAVTESTARVVTGTGYNVAIATEIYSIEVPTQATVDKLFDFDVDPQGLVTATAAKKYGDGVTIGENTGLLFPNYSDDFSKVTGVSDTSDPLVITNKSSKGVKLDIAAKYVAGSGDYAGGYSTTPDFSGQGDNQKGVYFGLTQSGDLGNYFDATGIGGNATTYRYNAIKSSASQYETKVQTAAAIGAQSASYVYALKADAKDFSTYEFQIEGQLNDEMAESTWYTVASHGVTPKTFGTLQLTFTASLISAEDAYDKHGVAYIRPSDGVMVVGKAEENGHPAGDLGETKAAAVIINEKGNGVAPTVDNAAGFSIITWDQILTTFGYSGDTYAIGTDNATELMNKLQTVTFTYGNNKYYADVIVAQF